MQILGMTHPTGDPVVTFALEHGADPALVSSGLGFPVLRPLSADLVDGDIVVRLLVEDSPNGAPPSPPRTGRDTGLVLRPGEVPAVRQRVAAYALVRSERGLLATEFSDRTAVPGLWGLPGGGIDPGEAPEASVVRELAEETGQPVDLGTLQRIQTSHWVGRAPDGSVEDFHAVRLVYDGSCPEPSDPVVSDVGGTTESARWVPLDDWRSLAWTVGWQEILSDLLG